jgi:hypothetical protein
VWRLHKTSLRKGSIRKGHFDINRVEVMVLNDRNSLLIFYVSSVGERVVRDFLREAVIVGKENTMTALELCRICHRQL